MAQKITFEEKGDFIRIEVSGDRVIGKETEDTFITWSKVADKCRETGISNVLAIIKLSGRLPADTSYITVRKAYEFGWSRDFSLALVYTNEDSLRDKFFTELVANSRGYTMKIFNNEQDASVWLLNSKGVKEVEHS